MGCHYLVTREVRERAWTWERTEKNQFWYS